MGNGCHVTSRHIIRHIEKDQLKIPRYWIAFACNHQQAIRFLECFVRASNPDLTLLARLDPTLIPYRAHRSSTNGNQVPGGTKSRRVPTIDLKYVR